MYAYNIHISTQCGIKGHFVCGEIMPPLFLHHTKCVRILNDHVRIELKPIN